METYRFSHFSGKTLDELGYIDGSSLHKSDNGDIGIIPHTSWGDYIGDTVDRANHKILLEKDWAYDVHGDYGSRAIGVDLTNRPEELDDILRALDNYPILDDNILSEVETELEQEDWDSWIEMDIRRELNKIDFDNDDITQEDLQRIARENEICWVAGSAVCGHIDIDAIVEVITNECTN